MKQLLFLTFLLTFSQINAQFLCKSYLILSNKDSIEGFVQWQIDTKMSEGIWFSRENDAKKLQFISPDKIEKLHLVEEDLTYNSVNFFDSKDTPKVMEKRLARLMQSGFCYLFKLSLSDDDKKKVNIEENSHVYIIRKNGSDYVLTINGILMIPEQGSQLMKGEAYYETNRTSNINRLLNLFSDMPELKPEIEKMPFTDKSIKKIIKLYNIKNQKFSKYFTQNYKAKTNFHNQLVVGLIALDFKNKEISSTSFDIGLSREFANKDTNPKTSFQFEASCNVIRRTFSLSMFTNFYLKSYFQQGFFTTFGASYIFFNEKSTGLQIGIGHNKKKINLDSYA